MDLEYRDDRKYEKMGKSYKKNFKEVKAKEWILEKKEIQKKKQQEILQEKIEVENLKKEEENQKKLFGMKKTKKNKPKKSKGTRRRKISKSY